MIKNKLLIPLLLSILFSQAQERKYYEFGWKKKYGIVDDKGYEIVAPIYLWTVYTLDKQSQYTALNSYENGGLIINNNTGKIEKFDFMDDTTVLNLGDEDYIYAYNENENSLINTIDVEKRINLAKNYQQIKQEGDYLFCYLDDEKGDILSKSDLKIVKENLAMTNNMSYFTTDEEIIFVINQQNATLFLNKNLKQIASTEKQLSEFEEVKRFLFSKNITLKELNAFDVIDEASGTPPNDDYPTTSAKMKGEYMQYNINYSENESLPFFKFKKKNYSVYRYRDNKIRLATSVEHNIIMHLLFYFDLNSKTILLPKKYWGDIELQLIF